MGTKLYVGNLNYNTTEDLLREAFGANGREVTSVAIIMDRETGRSRGFAFVEMSTSEFAQQALRDLDGQELDGRMLRINEARERESRPSGGPGGPPRPFSPRPGGYAGGEPGAPSSGGGYRPSGPPSGGPSGPPGGGYRPPGPGGAPGGSSRPPGSGFTARPGGSPGGAPGGDRGRRGNDRDKDKERGGGGVDRKKKRRNPGEDGW